MAAVLKVCVMGKTSSRETGWKAAVGRADGEQGDEAWLHSTCILKAEPKGFAEGLGYTVGEVGLKHESQIFDLNDWKSGIASYFDDTALEEEDWEKDQEARTSQAGDICPTSVGLERTAGSVLLALGAVFVTGDARGESSACS